jgi:hypothetical protein
MTAMPDGDLERLVRLPVRSIRKANMRKLAERFALEPGCFL